MIEEFAQVVAFEGDDIWVETQRKSACGQCSANKGCGTAVLSKVLGNKRSTVRVLNPNATKVSIGDEIVVGIEEQALVRGSLAIYLAPLLALFVFGLLGGVLAEQFNLVKPDTLVIVFSLFGLGLGFMWVKRFSGVISRDPRYQPVLLHHASQAGVLKTSAQ
ncbi:MAG: SoxR reducing system RseC family protein [Gammaproteobacteria bacterium]|nr:SoxR reducing system RseC family protein [Gammaproteobacteria bacterium]